MEENTPTTGDQGGGDLPKPIFKACDSCRKKKIRCEPTASGCVQCTKYKTDCHFTPISMIRKPRRPAGFKHITRLEDRLKKVEGHLEDALQGKRPEGGESSHKELAPFGTFSSETLGNTQGQNELQVSAPVTFSSPLQATTLGGNSFESIFPSSPWFQRPPGMLSILHNTSISPMHTSPTWKGSLALGPFSLPSFHELPSKPRALELIEDNFRNFNRFFPLFDEQDFLEQFHNRYLASSPIDPAWWACINVVFSMAHRFRAMRTLETTYENAESCGYIHNALAVVSELNVLQDSLPAVQALLGMAVILQGSPNPHASSVLTAAAVRLAQAMGLHRKTSDPNLSEALVEQRRRVFWITYFLDRDISLRMGQPFAQDDDDMDAELPRGSPVEIPLSNGQTSTINFFNSRIGLAIIQGQVYKRLYSVRASQQSETEKAAVAQELNTVLSYWRSSVPVDLEDHPVGPLEPPLKIEFIHMLILRFTYVNCLVMIHRHLPETDSHSVEEVTGGQSLPAPSESICTIECRKAIRLIQMTPPGDYACVWILLQPFFAAVTVLLEHVLRCPASPQARSDLHIVEPFLRLLDILAVEDTRCSRSEEARRMYLACNDLNRGANEALERAYQRITVG